MLTSVCLQVEVILIHCGHAAIDDRPRLRIPVLRCMFGAHGEETRVMALAANNNRQLRVVRSLAGTEFAERFAHLRHLFSDDNSELSLEENEAMYVVSHGK